MGTCCVLDLYTYCKGKSKEMSRFAFNVSFNSDIPLVETSLKINMKQKIIKLLSKSAVS